jgi:hypothetical protein
MTDAQLLMLTSNVFLAAWIGKHWLNGVLFITYAAFALLK